MTLGRNKLAKSGTDLADLAPGQCGEVLAVAGSGPVADRLRELGLTPGTEVTVLRRAPFGGPAVYSLRGYQLCLRPSEASRVHLR